MTTLALPLLSLPTPVFADRTGKYSTKLTAKRRYLPRIARGVRLLSAERAAARRGESLPEREEAVRAFKEEADDMAAAMELFATTYFSEGNRISERERELEESVRQYKEGVGGKGLEVAAKAVNRYVEVAKLAESVGVVDLGG